MAAQLHESRQDKMFDGFDFLRQPTDLQTARMRSVSTAAQNLAHTIFNTVPRGPDQSAAIRKVREAMMTACAAIVEAPEQL